MQIQYDNGEVITKISPTSRGLRFLRVEETIYLASSDETTHVDIKIRCKLDLDQVIDAGFIRGFEAGDIVLYGRSSGLKIGNEGSNERRETARILTEVTGQEVGL